MKLRGAAPLLLPEPISLKRRILNAGSWRLGGFALSNAIRLGSNLVMTRLLVPEMFGVMAIATLVMVGLAMFSDVGLRLSIIQNKRGDDPAFLNTAWSIQIIRGLILWLFALCVALLIFAANRVGLVPKGSVYADPLLPIVVAVVSISGAIGGFQSTKASQASRKLTLGRVTQMQIAAQISGLVCMISWAMIDRSIWALVAGSICSSLVAMLLSHIWLPGVANRWHWDSSAFYEIFHFGKWMFLSTILGFFANNTDRIFLGGLVDSATLGIYSIAFMFVSTITQLLSSLIGDISFPAFSEVARERPTHLRRTLYRFHMLIASFAYCCAGGLIVSGDTLIALLYDPRYAQAGWMLEILAVGLLGLPFHLARRSLLALGMPRIFTILIAIRMAAMLALIPLGFHFFGLPGVLWAVVAAQLSILPPTIYWQIKYDLFELSSELLALPAFLVGMILGGALEYVAGH
jgi:O-antigen/teichoic acid export membrane protein